MVNEYASSSEYGGGPSPGYSGAGGGEPGSAYTTNPLDMASVAAASVTGYVIDGQRVNYTGTAADWPAYVAAVRAANAANVINQSQYNQSVQEQLAWERSRQPGEQRVGQLPTQALAPVEKRPGVAETTPWGTGEQYRGILPEATIAQINAALFAGRVGAESFFKEQTTGLPQGVYSTGEISRINPATGSPFINAPVAKQDIIGAIITAPEALYEVAGKLQEGISGVTKNVYDIPIPSLPEAQGMPFQIPGVTSASPRTLANTAIAGVSTLASTVPFVLSIPYGAKFAVTQPAAVPGKAYEIVANMLGDIAKSEVEHPGSAIGIAGGMYVGGKAIGRVLPELPTVKYGKFGIPIETPKGLPEMVDVIKTPTRGFPVEIKTEGHIVYKMPSTEISTKLSESQKPYTVSEPIQYQAVYKGLYFDTNIKTPLGQTGTIYGGKIPLVGTIFEPGGKLLQGIGGGKVIGPAIEAGRNIPVASQIIGYLESKPSVLTGLWIGKESVRNAGRTLKSRVSGTVDFLNDYKPEIQIQRLQALEGVISPTDVEYVRSIITVRDITSSGKVKLQQVEPFGSHTPVTMKPKTFEAIKEYINANPEDIRLYGSLVGKTYLGKAGRSTLGDVDALMKSSKAQGIADSMWDIYLKNEFENTPYTIRTTETTRMEPSGKTSTDVLREAVTQKGEILSKLETGASQITGHRIMGLTTTGEHALDLHPITDLKFKTSISGTTAKTIPVEDLIWGKQTIGNPPIGSVTISKIGTESVTDIGGRVKDLYDTRSFAAKSAETAYLNKEYRAYAAPLEKSFNILNERLANVEQKQHIGGYPKEITLETFQKEFVNPLESTAVKAAKTKNANVELLASYFPNTKAYGYVVGSTYANDPFYAGYRIRAPDAPYRPYIPISTKAYTSQPYVPVTPPYAPVTPPYTPPVTPYAPVTPPYTPPVTPPYTPPVTPPYTPPGYPPTIPPVYPPTTPPGYPPTIPPVYPPTTPPGYPPTIPPYRVKTRRQKGKRFGEVFSFDTFKGMKVPGRLYIKNFESTAGGKGKRFEEVFLMSLPPVPKVKHMPLPGRKLRRMKTRKP